MPDPSEVRTTSTTGGQKGAKLARYDLIPAGPLHTLAELYGKGAEKYEDRNWERGYAWSLSFAALNRHLWLFWQGVNTDAETGLPHLAAVAWHALALMEWANTHPEFDNRPTHTRLSEAVAAVLDEDDRSAPKLEVELIGSHGWREPEDDRAAPPNPGIASGLVHDRSCANPPRWDRIGRRA